MEALTDNSLMPFGQYKGKRMDEVPDGYLLYLWDQWKSKGKPKHLEGKLVYYYIVENLDAILENVKRENRKTQQR